MSLLATNVLVLVMAALIFWWMSGFDPRLTLYDKNKDYARRALRSGISLLLVEVCFLYVWRFVKFKESTAGYSYLAAAIPLALIWSSCLGAMGAQFFTWLIFPDDRRHFHPSHEVMQLDKIGGLIRSGKKTEAIRMCQSLKASGEVSPASMEMTLEHLGVPQKTAKPVKPFSEAAKLRVQGKFKEAVAILNSQLSSNPRDVEAAILLMRIYAQNLSQPDGALRVLRALEKQPHMSAAHLDFARRSIHDWSNPQPEEPEALPPVGTVDELLSWGFVGTAIESMEEKVAAKPEDFDLQMKLAQLYALNANNLGAAERIVAQMEGKFTPEQLQFAGTRLKEWKQKK